MSNKAHVVRFATAGVPQVLTLETIDLPDPGMGEVQVRQSAVGLNYMEVYHRSGYYPLPLPSGVGTEAAGVIERIGPGVTGIAIGARVAYASGAPGAYADLRNMPADRLIEIPEGISTEEVAAVLMKGMTVEYLLDRCYQLRAGEFALFYAAAGGVGLLAGQWGRNKGARMIGVASGAEKCRLARENGYEFVIDRSKEDIVAQIKKFTAGAGVPVVYDSIGKATFETTIQCLAPRGFFVSFGTTTGSPPPVEASLLQKCGSLYFTRPTLVTYCSARPDMLASAAKVFAAFVAGKIKSNVGKRYALADAVRAHTDLESGATTGASLLIP